jgi:hypothetical protein
MKKLLYLIAALLCFSILCILLIWLNLSSLVNYVLRSITAGDVQVSRIEKRFQDGRLIISLGQVKLKGSISGVIGTCVVVVNLEHRPSLESISLTDFDLEAVDSKGKMRFPVLPAQSIGARNGSIVYDHHKFIVHECTVANFMGGKPFTFSAVLGSNGDYKALTVTGDGLYEGKLSSLKGRILATGLDMGRWSHTMKGEADAGGTFSYGKRTFTFNGSFRVIRCELKDRILKRPLVFVNRKGNLTLVYNGNLLDLEMRDMLYENVPFRMRLKLSRGDLSFLEISSGYLNMRDVRDWIALENVSKGSSSVWEIIQDGQVKIDRLIHEGGKPFRAELDLRKTVLTYGGKTFGSVEGLLSLKDKEIQIPRLEGRFKSSQFYDFSGRISLAQTREIRAQGSFMVNLRDIPHLFNVGALRFRDGSTQGNITLEGNARKGYAISGTGSIRDADVTWKQISALATGSYRFTGDEITFDPLILKRGGTDMVIRGKWNKSSMNFLLKGSLDVEQIKTTLPAPLETNGIVDLDMTVRKEGATYGFDGGIVMDRLAFVIPKIIVKDRGIASRATIKASVKGQNAAVDQLLYNLGVINVNLRGSLQDKTLDFRAVMDSKELEKASRLFFFSEETAKGDAALDLSVTGLRLPITRLPHVTGFLRVKNGFFRLPSMTRPLEEINLTGDFSGDMFNITLTRLTCGKNLVSKGELRVDGLESPHFSLRLDMESLNLEDFQDQFKFTLHPLGAEGLVAKLAGDITLLARKFVLGSFTGTELETHAKLAAGVFTISGLKADTLGGKADLAGRIDVAKGKPVVSAAGKLTGIGGSLLLAAFGSTNHVFERKATLSGALSSEGTSWNQLVENLGGTLMGYSTDGIIKKWDLLSKLFGVLNLYHLFGGKMDFSAEGLPYKRMGLMCTVKGGVFHTEDFLIDSSSMLVTGKGDLDLRTQTINMTMTVSPLVAVDRTLSKIPILGRLLRSPKKGFLYASYGVRGPLKDPTISVNFVETIGGRTVELLRNILTLPMEVFDLK